MKILYSCFSKSWGGMEMFSVLAAVQLKKRNFDVDFICLPDSKIHHSAIQNNLNAITLNAHGYLNLTAIFKLTRLLKKNAYNIIHTQASKDLWTLVPAIKLAHSKSPLFLTKQLGSYIKKMDPLHRFLYKRINAVFAISEMVKKNVLETCPVNEDKIYLMPNGIDLNKFDGNDLKRDLIRKDFQFLETDIVCGMLARLSPGKGHEEFIEAASTLVKKFKNVKFLIVGEASYNENKYADQLKEKAKKSLAEEYIIFSGFRSDTPEILSAMDIFVFPSHSEALGIALIEAMAMKKPSVCAAYDGILDVAVNNSTSLLFERKNSIDLASKLEELIVSESKRRLFAENARNRAVEKFDIEKLTDQTIDLYKLHILKQP